MALYDSQKLWVYFVGPAVVVWMLAELIISWAAVVLSLLFLHHWLWSLTWLGCTFRSFITILTSYIAIEDQKRVAGSIAGSHNPMLSFYITDWLFSKYQHEVSYFSTHHISWTIQPHPCMNDSCFLPSSLSLELHSQWPRHKAWALFYSPHDRKQQYVTLQTLRLNMGDSVLLVKDSARKLLIDYSHKRFLDWFRWTIQTQPKHLSLIVFDFWLLAFTYRLIKSTGFLCTSKVGK